MCCLDLGLSTFFVMTGDTSKTLDTLLEWLEPFKGEGQLDYKQSLAVSKLFHSYVEQLPKIEVGLVSCLRLMTKIALAPESPVSSSKSSNINYLCLA